MNKNLNIKTSDSNSSFLNHSNNEKDSVQEELNTNIISYKLKELDKTKESIINSCDKILSQNMNSDSKNSLNNSSEKEPLKNRKSGTLLNKKKEEDCASVNNSNKDIDIVLDTEKTDKEKLDNENNDSKCDTTENKELGYDISSNKQQIKNNLSDSGYIESLKCEIEEKKESKTIQKYKSKLNPIAPEFKPQNTLHIYQKIQQQTKKNIILLIKSFAYKGIKLENISGEYCKKYNALLNLSHAGFTNIFDLLKSLDYCLIYEEVKEEERNDEIKIEKNVNEKDLENNREEDTQNKLENNLEKNIEKDAQKNVENESENNIEKYVQKNIKNESGKNIEKNIQEGIENDSEKIAEKDTIKDVKNDLEKKTEIDMKIDTEKNKGDDVEISDNNEKNRVSEKNLIIKYKTPKMDDDKQFFVKIILGTLAECTNYNSKLSDEETPINNSVSLTKLPQEVKKLFGSFFNLKALQIRCGIDKLQIFLEEIQEIQILASPNDIKLRITPQTFDSKIPELKYIKSLTSNELKYKSPTKLNSKKHSISMQFLDKNISFNSYKGDSIFSMHKDKNNSLDNIQLIKSMNSSDMKNVNYSFNKSNESSKLPQKSLKNILFGESSNILSNDSDSILPNKFNDNSNFKSNIYSNDLINIYSKNKFSNSKEYSNKKLIPKILTRMQLHILLFQLIVILSERQKIEWNEISKIKYQILYSNSRISENKDEKDESQENIETEKSINRHTYDIDDSKETEINNNEDKKKVNILDFINTSGTNGSSEYLNESFETNDTSNLFKSENISSDKYTKNSDFFNSYERENSCEQFVGVFVSSIKSEWNKTYSDQFPLSFYLNYYKTKKLRKLLEEIPNLIIAGYGRAMQVFTLYAAQEYYDNLFSDKQANFKTFTKSKFTSLSNSPYFNDITYQDIAKAYVNGDTINLLNILGRDDFIFPRMNINKYYNKFTYKSNKRGNYYNLGNYRDINKSYKHDDFEKKNSFSFKNENLEILRYHLHKLLYNLVIHVCKKQNSLFLKYKANGIILSEYEMNKQLCGPVFYSSDLTYEDFVISKKTYFEKEQIKKSVYILSQHGIYGIKFIHLTNEWFKLYKCELRPLMKICNYQKIGQMICNMPNVYVVGEGFDSKYIPNTQLDNEHKTSNDLVAGTITKTPSDNYSYNNIANFQRITQAAANIPKHNMAYESIMKLLFPNASSQRSANMKTYFNSYSSFRGHNEYKKNKSIFPDIHNSYSLKNGISINHLFKNL